MNKALIISLVLAFLVSLTQIYKLQDKETPFLEKSTTNQKFHYDCQNSTTPCLQYEFSFMNYTWRSKEEYDHYFQNQLFNQTLLAGVKTAKNGRMFVSLPRWKKNAHNETNPATVVEIKQGQNTRNPLMTPYPSWELNEPIMDVEHGYNSDAIQSVLGMEIVNNTLWVLDQANINGQYVPGTIKLLKINLDLDRVEYVHRFSEDIAGPHSFLNDLVVDQKNDFIYITDSNIFRDLDEPLQGAIISVDVSVIPFRVKKQLSGNKYTKNDDSMWLTINGEKVMYDTPMRTAADGIALTPDCKYLTWCALTSHEIYQIPTKYLRDFDLEDKELEKKIRPVFQRNFSSDGLAYGSNGDLFLTSLEGSGVYKYNDYTSQYLTQNSENSMWPDTFGFNGNGSIVYTSNQLHNFNNDQINFYNISQPFYRIYSLNVGTNSYLDGKY